MLRSALWQARDDFRWATRVSAWVGRVFAYLFIAAGIALVIWESAFSGLWLVFIGWFLLQAAGFEDRYLLARQALAGLHVRDLMVREPVTTSPDVTLGEFMDELVWHRRYTTYPVTENGRAVGLLPFRCVAEVPRREWDTRRVRDCMLPREAVPVVDPDDDLIDAAAELSDSDVEPRARALAATARRAPRRRTSAERSRCAAGSLHRRRNARAVTPLPRSTAAAPRRRITRKRRDSTSNARFDSGAHRTRPL